MKNITRIKIRGYHCDSYGHVNNARYLELLEEGRWCLLEENLGLDYWAERGMGFVVASISINYRRASSPGDVLEIHSEIGRLGGKSGIIHQEVFNVQTGKAVADADITFVVMDMKSGRVLAMEGEVRAGFDLVANQGRPAGASGES